MDYKYNLDELHQTKEEIEKLSLVREKLTNRALPKVLEKQFWKMHIERTRLNTIQFFWSGLVTYIIFILFTVPGDYMVIEQRYFVSDFIRCILSVINGAVCLLTYFAFAMIPSLKPYFYKAACFIVLWAIVLTSILMMTVQSEALKNQAMLLISFIYMLGFILSGLKPIHMLMVGMVSALITLAWLSMFNVYFHLIILTRALIGSCLLGFAISSMLVSKERMLFLNAKLAEINENIQRIHASEFLHLSQHDGLTQISNRRSFDEMLDVFYLQTRRDNSSLGILFIDIDFFKNYNDFYGHQLGDHVIASLAKAIKNSIRHMDFVARYGGEEFVVLLPETDAQGAYAVASNIYRSIERLEILHEKSNVSNQVTISLGITVYRGEPNIDQKELLSYADQALYRAKKLGRNQIYYHSLRGNKV
ncbi:GGDEF domain-containing protein [Acinetobacter guerrae]|uniref:diguanylate cyclase n=1 Tax=Acinetobacter guerrae TaxID=1843371 RepID=A0A3A8EGW9_9GAMM|nr:diguanylate cyclase [Acinetobacter guerrae]RKG33358.1 GGDEF domain-containing protein [Acinetobacter guerrae]